MKTKQFLLNEKVPVFGWTDGVPMDPPRAYKNIDSVMAAQEELVEIVHTLKQVLCVKG